MQWGAFIVCLTVNKRVSGTGQGSYAVVLLVSPLLSLTIAWFIGMSMCVLLHLFFQLCTYVYCIRVSCSYIHDITWRSYTLLYLSYLYTVVHVFYVLYNHSCSLGLFDETLNLNNRPFPHTRPGCGAIATYALRTKNRITHSIAGNFMMDAREVKICDIMWLWAYTSRTKKVCLPPYMGAVEQDQPVIIYTMLTKP